MGTILLPVCKNCNYREETLPFGHGRGLLFPEEKKFNFPGINKDTETVEYDNLLAPEKSPLNFTFYNEPGMSKAEASGRKINFGDQCLEVENNLCPKCQTFELTFLFVGMFD